MSFTNWLSPTVWTGFLVVFLYHLYRQSAYGMTLLAIGPVLFSTALIVHGLRVFVTRVWLRRSLTVAGYALIVCSFAVSLFHSVTR